jgi:hypothetical protein
MHNVIKLMMKVQLPDGQLVLFNSVRTLVDWYFAVVLEKETYLWYPEHRNLLLLKVPSVFLVYEDEVQVVPDAELLIDIAEGRCQVEATKK